MYAKATSAEMTHASRVRHVLSQHGRISTPVDQLLDTSDLYSAGLTSLATVSVMLALEEQFDIEFPDNMLGRKTFGSIESIVGAIEQLVQK
jgi:acyl carrier protein